MAESFAQIEARQAEARLAFGRMLRLWRERNGWTQYTVADWGKESGFSAISYGNLSAIEQGKACELRRPAFFQLAEVNRRIAEEDWSRLKTQALKDKLNGATAIVDDDGTLWGPIELWSCYVGLRPVPTAFQPKPRPEAPPVALQEARALSQTWRELVSSAVDERDLDAFEAVQEIARQAPLPLRKQLRTVLTSFGDYEPEQLKELWDGEWLPERWIHAWLETLPPAAGAAEPAGGSPEAAKPRSRSSKGTGSRSKAKPTAASES
ncbi:helix-turn-helix domain-containing protein [Synechococcus sp. 1G10]|uniref:helix-turn-helix domain-containing protein n=1 Tax=Synechococcus sp. 1G10 TaxID=2025605 RepID=UPI000B99C6DA|nr:helix-turn-helix transcriptional regulator [Synechococcus sp. 1G10]